MGTFLAVFGGACWAITAICGQYVFEESHFNALWYVTVRLLASGMIMMLIAVKAYGKGMFDIWKDKKDRIDLLVYGIIALMGVQVTHFLAIQCCNAATATVIMYLSPVIVLAYVSFRNWQKPTLVELLGVALAVAGAFLLVTHGEFDSLTITGIAFFWSLVSAILMAFYSIQPKALLERWGSLLTNAWGMLLGGLALGVINPPWKLGDGILDGMTIAMMAFVVIIGTVIGFFCYLKGMGIVGPKKASVYACSELFFAALLGVFCLDIPFSAMDWLGSALIVGTVVLLAMEPKRGEKEETKEEETKEEETI